MKGFKWWDKIQAAEAKVVARVRAVIGIMAASGLAFADQVKVVLGEDLTAAHTWALRIKLASVACIGLSLLLRAGEKNTPGSQS